MALITQRIARGLLPAFDPYRTPPVRTTPERIILGAAPGQRPSSKPPVRIFLGTERNQFRAERVFLWSVERHRDPGRIYEIHLLRGLKGFATSRFWVTGFTNYRFAIPRFCGFRGRAIYNDVDQIYLTDPAELFDRPMGEAGFLSINDHDTSVMVMDCGRMQAVWNPDAVRRGTRKKLEAAAREAGLWGPLEARWNARDAEYRPGESAVVHFTTLHTQPWRPFPEHYVYADNPTGRLWPDLEEEADRAGFMPVSALRPSTHWPDFLLEVTGRDDGEMWRGLLAPNAEPQRIPHRRVVDFLERVPDADIPWVLDRLMAASETLEIHLREPLWIRAARPRRSRHFWLQQLQRAARRNPQTRWRLHRRVGPFTSHFRGGPPADGPIRLLGPGPEAAGDLAATIAGRLASELAARTGRELASGDGEAAVIVASGAAARSARRSGAAVVLVGPDCGPVPDSAGVAVEGAHRALLHHPGRIRLDPATVCALVATRAPAGVSGDDRVQAWLGAAQRRVLLLGERVDSQRALAGLVRGGNGEPESLVIIDCGLPARLRRRLTPLAESGDVTLVQRDSLSAPALTEILAAANRIVAAGAGEDILARAAASRRPLQIASPGARTGRLRHLRQALIRRALRPRYNRRGSIEPQQGLTYVLARAVQRGWIPVPDPAGQFESALIDAGLASPAGGQATPAGTLRDRLAPLADDIARRLDLVAPAAADGRDAGRPGGER